MNAGNLFDLPTVLKNHEMPARSKRLREREAPAELAWPRIGRSLTFTENCILQRQASYKNTSWAILLPQN
jgi:hypothetical protein